MYMYNWHQLLSIPVEWVATGYKSKCLTAKAVDYLPEINHKFLSIVPDWFNILYYNEWHKWTNITSDDQITVLCSMNLYSSSTYYNTIN